MTTFKVGYMIGSLAKEAINRELAQALLNLAPESLQFTEIPRADRAAERRVIWSDTGGRNNVPVASVHR